MIKHGKRSLSLISHITSFLLFVVLGLIYFIGIVPLALVLKIFGKKTIPLKFDIKINSYRVNRDGKILNKSEMEKIY